MEPLGDSAYILKGLTVPAYALAAALNADKPVGVIEAVASYDSVGLYIEPESFDVAVLDELPEVRPFRGLLHSIPCCYEMGPDLETIAEHLELSLETVVRLHSAIEYRCYAIGFAPGFPYLGYLPEPLAGVPRLPSPRTRVEPGSVAMTGLQTGIYPLERPGGWSILGMTPLVIVDVDDDYFPISAGDRVRFTPISREEYRRRKGERL